MPEESIVVKTWSEFTPDDVFEMAVLRSEVFFLEQKITEEEFDAADRDPSTIHLWVSDDRGMAGYLRIVDSPASDSPAAAHAHEGIAQSLGRMVVRADVRGQGLAERLMTKALDIAGENPLYLHAQDYVTGLYAKFGFEERGEVFMEAGIPHRLMVRVPVA
jgi:ElaA protein